MKKTLFFIAGEGGGEGKHVNKIIQYARQLRKNSTDVENYLWYFLRSRRFHQYKFRRQHPIGIYFVDFVCLHKKLVIELDGSQHVDAIYYDKKRSDFLRTLGYKIIRFWNHEIFENMENVLASILLALEHQEPSPPPSPAIKNSVFFNFSTRERELFRVNDIVEI